MVKGKTEMVFSITPIKGKKNTWRITSPVVSQNENQLLTFPIVQIFIVKKIREFGHEDYIFKRLRPASKSEIGKIWSVHFRTTPMSKAVPKAK